jgi:hypothetical protein
VPSEHFWVGTGMARKSRETGLASEGHRDDPRADSSVKAPEPVAATSVTPSVAQRVETVLEAAELAAAKIPKDAEQWAKGHLEDAGRRADTLSARRAEELSSITEGLLARAHVAVRQSDDLIKVLDAAGGRAMALIYEDGSTGNGERSASQTDEAEQVSAAARLLATRMAIEGSRREDRIATTPGIRHR